MLKGKLVSIFLAVYMACTLGTATQEAVLWEIVTKDLPQRQIDLPIASGNTDNMPALDFKLLATNLECVVNGSKGKKLPNKKPAENAQPPQNTQPPEKVEQPDASVVSLNIAANGKTFTATLEDSATVRALIERLPLSINMSELNGNEKFYFFDEKLPSNARQQGQIMRGDLMLYGADCLVLFYESFESSYSYTKIGSIDNPDGLEEALGGGAVQIDFSLK